MSSTFVVLLMETIYYCSQMGYFERLMVRQVVKKIAFVNQEINYLIISVS